MSNLLHIKQWQGTFFLHRTTYKQFNVVQRSMKIALLILAFIVLSLYSYGQFAFVYDTIEQRNQRDIKLIDSLYHVTKEGDFQLLFWMLPEQEVRRTLLVLTSKNGQWQARYLERVKEDGSFIWKERAVSQEGLDNLWKELQENDVLHIKTSSDLKTVTGQAAFKPVEKNGILYFFELLDRKGKRSYYYRCPNYQQQYFNHIEFTRIVNMIQLLYKFTKEKEKPIC